MVPSFLDILLSKALMYDYSHNMGGNSVGTFCLSLPYFDGAENNPIPNAESYDSQVLLCPNLEIRKDLLKCILN